MRQLIKEYFSFTRKERIAIIGLAVLILSAYLLPYFIKPPGKAPSAQELEEFRKLERQLSEAKRSNTTYREERNTTAHGPPPERLFYFDPNTVSAEGWKQLGLRSKTIGTILKYLSKGGRFYEAIDLKKIYGLKADEYARLERYIRISKPAGEDRDFSNRRADPPGEHAIKYPGASSGYEPGSNRRSTTSSRNVYRAPPDSKTPIDINTADTTAWISLPGIGSKLAARIVNFRDRLGGFYSIEQVREIYGLHDSTFQKILPRLTKGSHNINKININTANAEILKQHPYIKWSIASAIIRYREQHGPFGSLEGLLQVAVVTQDVYRKVLPYLTLTPE